MNSPVRSHLAIGLAVLSLALAPAGTGYEGPTTFKASEVAPAALLEGKHHRVAPEVKADGYLLRFQLTSDFGPFEAAGQSMLATRVQEIEGLAQLQEVSKSEVFVKAAGESVVNVGKGVVGVVTKPGETAKGIGGAVSGFAVNLGRKTKRAAESATEGSQEEGKSGAEGAASATEGAAKDILGVNSAVRRWAQKVHVDPYTTNPVLRKALEDVAKVDTSGAIAAKVVVPIPMVVSATATVGDLVWTKDPEELLKLNEKRFQDAGAGDAAVKALSRNKFWTLTYQTRFAAALDAVKAKGGADYVDTASRAQAEREALFYVESAEMLARFHAATPVTQVLSDSRAMVAKAGDGRAVALVPVDWIAWTEPYAKAVAEIGERSKKELGATGLELRLTGRMSDRAKQETKALGWTVTENVPGLAETPKTAAAALDRKSSLRPRA
jgi:hypothetical protein